MARYKVVVMTFEDALVSRVTAGLEGLASVAAMEPVGDVAGGIGGASPDVVILDQDAAISHGAGFDGLVEAILGSAPRATILAIGDETSPQSVLSALRAGAADFIDREAGPAEIEAQFNSHIARKTVRAGVDAGSLGRSTGDDGERSCVAYVAARPVDDSCFLAMNYALLRAKACKDNSAGKPDAGRDEDADGAEQSSGDGKLSAVLLIDFDLPSTDIAVALDLDLSYTIRDAVLDLPRLDDTLVTSAVPFHSSTGLYVLALGDSDDPLEDVTTGTLASLIMMMKAMFDEVVINLGSPALGIGFSYRQLLGLADHGFLVARPDLAGVKAAANMLRSESIDKESRSDMTLVSPGADKLLDLPTAKMIEVLGMKTARILPALAGEREIAINSAQPLMESQPNHPWLRAVAGLADAEDPGVMGPVGAGGALSRMTGAIADRFRKDR